MRLCSLQVNSDVWFSSFPILLMTWGCAGALGQSVMPMLTGVEARLAAASRSQPAASGESAGESAAVYHHGVGKHEVNS